MTIRVVIADDHRVVRDGLCYLLGQEPDVEVAGEAGDGRQAVDVVAATRPDVLLLDLYMPGLDGHAVLAALHDAPHRPAVVVLTSATDDEHLVRAMHAGATSYLLKTAPAEHVIAAVRDAAAGTASLSPDLLTRLTERSMLAVRPQAGGSTRYELLETLREYGRTRLGDARAAELFAAHARHFAAEAATVEAEL